MTRKKVMVSACLLGEKCRYDGSAKLNPDLILALQDLELISVCPECLGGLPTPRAPVEIQNGDGAQVLAGKTLVIDRQGADYTPGFHTGALQVLELYRQRQPDLVIFKAYSPSCGAGRIYDGTFTGKLRPGDGVTAALLRENGAVLCTELDYLPFLTALQS
jgi:uncharacterized protein YbbK (DUF523 family)